MSGDAQTTLDSAPEPAAGQETTTARDWTPGSDGVACQHCGRYAGEEFGTIFGDRSGTVHRCFGCATTREIFNGGAAGKDVPEARSVSPPRGPGKDGGQL